MDIKFDIKALNQLVKQLEGISDRANNLAPIAGNLYRVAERDFGQRFKSSPSATTTGEVYGGVQWKRLSDATLQSNPKRAKGKVLIDSGELRDSLKKGKPGNIAEVQGDTVTFGSSLKKAVWNDETRPIVVVHPELVRQSTEVLEKWVIGGKKK